MGNFAFSHSKSRTLYVLFNLEELVSQAWLSDTRIAVGTSNGKLLVYEHGDMISEILYMPAIEDMIQNEVTSFLSMACFSGDILVGTNGGLVLVYEKTDDEQAFRKSRTVKLEPTPITAISINASSDNAVCTLRNSQLYGIPLDADPAKQEAIKSGSRDQSIFQEFHCDQIVGLDTCARKPIIATCGADKSVRIWNYAEKIVEVSKYFTDAPQSVALHPSGLYVLVGFNDCLSLMTILIDNVRQFWSNSIRGCREV